MKARRRGGRFFSPRPLGLWGALACGFWKANIDSQKSVKPLHKICLNTSKDTPPGAQARHKPPVSVSPGALLLSIKSIINGAKKDTAVHSRKQKLRTASWCIRRRRRRRRRCCCRRFHVSLNPAATSALRSLPLALYKVYSAGPCGARRVAKLPQPASIQRTAQNRALKMDDAAAGRA